MILDRLILKNFKRFRSEEIHFKDGITGILGNNGTGKSSIVQAIFFALYGVQATGITADYIVSSFASPKDKCEVRLDFRIAGDNYSVHRTFKKGKSSNHEATFHREGKLMATGVSQVEEAVKRTLGMGPVDFRNTIYAGQKDLLTLLDNTPAKRKEWFLRALGIDYLNTESQKILKERIDTKASELTGKEGELRAMEGRQSEEEFACLQSSIAGFHAAIAEHTKARDQLAAKRKEYEAGLKLLADKRTVFAGLQQHEQTLRRERDAELAQAKQLEASIALLADEEAEIKLIQPVAFSYEERRKHLDSLREKRNDSFRLNDQLKHITADLADLATRAEKQKARIKELDFDFRKKAELVAKVRAGLGIPEGTSEDKLESAVNYRLAEINTRTGTLAAQLNQYEAERKKILADQKTIHDAGADGTCPLCRQKLGKHIGSLEAEFSTKLQELADKAVADLEKQEKLGKEKTAIDALKPSLDAIRTITGNQKQKPVVEAELAELEGKHARKIQEQHTLIRSLEQLDYRDELYQSCEKEVAEVQKVQLRFIALEKKIGQGVVAKDQLKSLKLKIADRNTELEKVAGEIKKSPFDPAEVAKLEAAVRETDISQRNEELGIANATKDLRFTDEKIAEYKKTASQIALLKQETLALNDEIVLLKLTRGIIAEYVVYLMQVVRSRIEGEVSRIISEITGGRYEQVLLDEDFNLVIRDIDTDYPIDRFSGGEQDDIAVALRIALSRYLAELHSVHESTFLIFDEIFGSQDEERRNNLLTALRTQESRFPQILLISHIPEMQGEFANTLIVEMGTDQSSRIREVD